MDDQAATTLKAGAWWLLLGSVAICLSAFLVCSSPSPTWPLPITGLAVLGLSLYASPIPVLIAGIGLLAWWVVPLLRGRTVFGTVAWGILAAAGLASVAWYLLNWDYAVRWQSHLHVLGCSVLSAATIVAVAVLGVLSNRRHSAVAGAFARALGTWWAITYGFPYFGELP